MDIEPVMSAGSALRGGTPYVSSNKKVNDKIVIELFTEKAKSLICTVNVELLDRPYLSWGSSGVFIYPICSDVHYHDAYDELKKFPREEFLTIGKVTVEDNDNGNLARIKSSLAELQDNELRSIAPAYMPNEGRAILLTNKSDEAGDREYLVQNRNRLAYEMANMAEDYMQGLFLCEYANTPECALLNKAYVIQYTDRTTGFKITLHITRNLLYVIVNGDYDLRLNHSNLPTGYLPIHLVNPHAYAIQCINMPKLIDNVKNGGLDTDFIYWAYNLENFENEVESTVCNIYRLQDVAKGDFSTDAMGIALAVSEKLSERAVRSIDFRNTIGEKQRDYHGIMSYDFGYAGIDDFLKKVLECAKEHRRTGVYVLSTEWSAQVCYRDHVMICSKLCQGTSRAYKSEKYSVQYFFKRLDELYDPE